MWIPPFIPVTSSDKALMLTVFGTSTEASVTFKELIPFVEKMFPDRNIVVPYTSGIIRDKLNQEIRDPDQKILSPAQMLEKLKTMDVKILLWSVHFYLTVLNTIN